MQASALRGVVSSKTQMARGAVVVKAQNKAAPNMIQKAVTMASAASLLSVPPAMAVQEVNQLALDPRLNTTLLLIVPAIVWVLINISGPVATQVEDQKVKKAKIQGKAFIGMALTAALLQAAPMEAAQELTTLATSTIQYYSIILLIAPAIFWIGIYLVSEKPPGLGEK